MAGHARDAHLEPQHAHLRGRDRGAEGLADHGGVRHVAGQERLERAVARALLLDHRLQVDGGVGRHPQPPQAPDGAEDGGEAALHVGGAAAVEPVIDRESAPNGSRSPHCETGSGLTTSMCPLRISDAPAAAFGKPGRHHVGLAVDIPVERGGPGMGPQRRGVHGDVDVVESQVAQDLAHDLLPHLFVPERGRRLHKAARTSAIHSAPSPMASMIRASSVET